MVRLGIAGFLLTAGAAACSSSGSATTCSDKKPCVATPSPTDPTAAGNPGGTAGSAGNAGNPGSAGGTSGSSGSTEPEWKAPVVATTSAGCGKAAPQPLANAVFTTPSGRKFRVFAPSNYDNNKRYPTALTFHGWYADSDKFEQWFKMEESVGNAGLTVYPDAVNGLWDLEGESDLLFFDELVKQLGDAYCINPSRVLAFGFSFGGKFVSHLACRRAGHVKAAAIGDGSDGGGYAGCGRLPMLFVHRTHDADELIAWGKGARDGWASRMGCSATPLAVGDPAMNCVSNAACKAPGSVEFCEDTFFDPTWPQDWNHTVRDVYRAYVWNWFNRQQ